MQIQTCLDLLRGLTGETNKYAALAIKEYQQLVDRADCNQRELDRIDLKLEEFFDLAEQFRAVAKKPEVDIAFLEALWPVILEKHNMLKFCSNHRRQIQFQNVCDRNYACKYRLIHEWSQEHQKYQLLQNGMKVFGIAKEVVLFRNCKIETCEEKYFFDGYVFCQGDRLSYTVYEGVSLLMRDFEFSPENNKIIQQILANQNKLAKITQIHRIRCAMRIPDGPTILIQESDLNVAPCSFDLGYRSEVYRVCTSLEKFHKIQEQVHSLGLPLLDMCAMGVRDYISFELPKGFEGRYISMIRYITYAVAGFNLIGNLSFQEQVEIDDCSIILTDTIREKMVKYKQEYFDQSQPGSVENLAYQLIMIRLEINRRFTYSSYVFDFLSVVSIQTLEEFEDMTNKFSKYIQDLYVGETTLLKNVKYMNDLYNAKRTFLKK